MSSSLTPQPQVYNGRELFSKRPAYEKWDSRASKFTLYLIQTIYFFLKILASIVLNDRCLNLLLICCDMCRNAGRDVLLSEVKEFDISKMQQNALMFLSLKDLKHLDVHEACALNILCTETKK